MKKIILTTLCSITCLLGFSQTDCDNRLDTAGVIKIAKRHNAYWTSYWVSPPQIKFDPQSCEWVVSSWKSEHTDKGDCKNTNGCTMITNVVLIIDAGTKKVKSRKKEVQIFPNYE